MRISTMRALPASWSTETFESAPAALVREIAYADPALLFARFAGDRYAVLLDSALTDGPHGRYSFIAVEPFRILTSKDGVIAIDGLEMDKLRGWLLGKHKVVTTALIHEEFQGLRVTPNVYTTLEEVDRFAELMISAIRNGLA